MKLIRWSIYLSLWVWHDGDVDYNDNIAFSDQIDDVNDDIHGDDANYDAVYDDENDIGDGDHMIYLIFSIDCLRISIQERWWWS